MTLLGVVRERVGVDLEQRLLVAGTEGADLHALGHLDRLQVGKRPSHDHQLALAGDPEELGQPGGAGVVAV